MGSFVDLVGNTITTGNSFGGVVDEFDAANERSVSSGSDGKSCVVEESTPGRFSLGTGDFTMELRFKPISNFASGRLLDSIQFSPGGGWYIEYNTSNYIIFYVYGKKYVMSGDFYQPDKVVRGNFNELVVVRRSGRVRCFLNRNLINETLIEENIDSGNLIGIGAGSYNSNNNGDVIWECCRITKNVCRYWEVEDLPPIGKFANEVGGTPITLAPVDPKGAANTFNPADDEHYASVVLHFTGGTVDRDLLDPLVGPDFQYFNGATVVNDSDAINDTVLYLPERHSKVVMTNPVDLALGDQDFTISFRMKQGSNYQYGKILGPLYEKGSGVDRSIGWHIYASSTGYLSFRTDTTSNFNDIPIQRNRWYDVDIVRENGVLYCYYDKVKSTNEYPMTNNFTWSPDYSTIGGELNDTSSSILLGAKDIYLENIVITKVARELGP